MLTNETVNDAVAGLLAQNYDGDAPYMPQSAYVLSSPMLQSVVPGFPVSPLAQPNPSPPMGRSPVHGPSYYVPEYASPSVRAVQSGEDDLEYRDVTQPTEQTLLASPIISIGSPYGQPVMPPASNMPPSSYAHRRARTRGYNGSNLSSRASEADRVAARISKELDDKLFSLKNKVYKDQIQQMLDEIGMGEYARHSISALQRPPICFLSTAERQLLSQLPAIHRIDFSQPTAKAKVILTDLLTSLVNKALFLLLVEHRSWYPQSDVRRQIAEQVCHCLWPAGYPQSAFHYVLAFVDDRSRNFRDVISRVFKREGRKKPIKHSTKVKAVIKAE